MAINYDLINSGATTVSGSFNLYGKNPLDSRLVIPGFDGLQTLIDNGAAYEGMIAYISSEKKHYEVKTIDGVLSYRQFGLTNDELNELITNATTAAMEFKGVTATLPADPAKGDMYKVSGETIDITIDGVAAKVGDSIVYNGEEWFLIPSGDDIEDTWRPIAGVANDATLTFEAGDKLDVAVASTGSVKYSHETIAAPELLAENEQTRTYITSVETDGFGHITGYKTATENVEDTNTTYEFECAAEHSDVYFTVKEKLNGEEVAEHTVCVDAYNKNQTDAKIIEAIEALDVNDISGFGAGKTLATLIETDGKIAATFQDIAITESQITDLGDYKTKQTAIEKVATAKNVFIEKIGQNENGEISIETKEVDFTEVNEAISTNAKSIKDYSDAHASDYTNEQIDKAIEYATGALGTMSTKDANDYFTKEEVNNANAVILSEAQKYADAKEHKDTTYTVASTENVLEFTVTPSEGDAQTVTLVAPDTGVMSVEAGEDIVVTPGENGKVTIAHETFTTGEYTKDPASSDKTGDVYMMTGVTIDNGHVTGAAVKSLASALQGMTFIFDGGTSTN